MCVNTKMGEAVILADSDVPMARSEGQDQNWQTKLRQDVAADKYILTQILNRRTSK